MSYHWRKRREPADQSKKDREALIKKFREELQKFDCKEDKSDADEQIVVKLEAKITELEGRQNQPFMARRSPRSTMFVRPSGGW